MERKSVSPVSICRCADTVGFLQLTVNEAERKQKENDGSWTSGYIFQLWKFVEAEDLIKAKSSLNLELLDQILSCSG